MPTAHRSSMRGVVAYSVDKAGQATDVAVRKLRRIPNRSNRIRATQRNRYAILSQVASGSSLQPGCTLQVERSVISVMVSTISVSVAPVPLRIVVSTVVPATVRHHHTSAEQRGGGNQQREKGLHGDSLNVTSAERPG